eukprot:NODE_484_length_7802_cov_0.227184.p1 type:complete len:765 gc:universal NODE_484_length_7802_cov_0.227184:5265-2971(-)
MSSNGSSQEESIQVMVRIRPSAGSIVVSDPIMGKQLQIPCSSSNYAITKTFVFDKVLGHLVDNKTVFQQVQPLIDQVLQGFNATILAYGQTSTGKTHTILGETQLDHARLHANAGIIPRAIHYIFDLLENKKGEILDFSIRISYLELYNEDLRDLLVESPESLKIFEENKKILVQGAEELLVRNIHHCLEMVQLASEKRQTTSTLCNEKSSRSHTIFIMQVLQREVVNGKEVIRVGKLNLVDLAGSESVGKSGVEKKGQREAGLINQSLLTLGRVINALVDKNSHVPYRESKLTRLLKDSLGGHTKTTLIATISGDKNSLEETLSTLDYSHRAKNIKVRPQINQKITKQQLLKGYLTEIDDLKRELTASRHKNGVYLPVDQYEALVNESVLVNNKNLILNNQISTYESTILKLQEVNAANEILISKYESDLNSNYLQYCDLKICLNNSNVLANRLNGALQHHFTNYSKIHGLLNNLNNHVHAMFSVHQNNVDSINTHNSALKAIAIDSRSELNQLNPTLILSLLAEFKQHLSSLETINAVQPSSDVSLINCKSSLAEFNQLMESVAAVINRYSNTIQSANSKIIDVSNKIASGYESDQMEVTKLNTEFANIVKSAINCTTTAMNELQASMNNQNLQIQVNIEEQHAFIMSSVDEAAKMIKQQLKKSMELLNAQNKSYHDVNSKSISNLMNEVQRSSVIERHDRLISSCGGINAKSSENVVGSVKGLLINCKKLTEEENELKDLVNEYNTIYERDHQEYLTSICY